jgi:hypothetical protein
MEIRFIHKLFEEKDLIYNIFIYVYHLTGAKV